ncbi:hypothetical protein ABH920_000011 [Catenulispora sp. EB89]|uniref:hypothetical protein n=1 Tax=Catenulispora sp. EB89 TaxID=3156257 RepID=UPI0035166BAD
MRIRYRGTATVALAALTATVATGVAFAPSATADARSTHATTGRVCMFDAPKGALSLGHVGWAFRWSDGSDTWDYGATLANSNWEKHGTEQQMLHDFATANDSGGYQSYRCKDTATDDQSIAESTVTAGFARSYNLINDNCLTRSIEIFKAYDGSGGLNSLPDGKFVFPNAYFNYDLSGWDASKSL